MAGFFNPQFQIVSDLHLETPIVQPCYHNFRLNVRASYLCLLGDIGLAKDKGLFTFLEGLLRETADLTVFYVLGNHEAYGMTLEDAHDVLSTFAKDMESMYGRRLIVMRRTRYDVSSTITLLGCTLWTNVTTDQASEVHQRLTDFNEARGIRNWRLSLHIHEHEADLDWLNREVVEIQRFEPLRQILVLTHHSPTVDPRANDPRFENSTVNSGFVSDLSMEACWTSPNVRCWAYGHTHYSSEYREEATGKLVVSNQKGYAALGASTRPKLSELIVEAVGMDWETVDIAATDPGDHPDKASDNRLAARQQEGMAKMKQERWTIISRIARRLKRR